MGGLWPIRAQQGLLNQQSSRWAPPGSAKDPLPGPRSRSCHFAQDALRQPVFLQSQTYSWALGKAGRCCLSWRHNLTFFGGIISWWGGTGGTRVSRALLAEVRAHLPGLWVQQHHQRQISHGLLLCISPKAFCTTLFLKERTTWWQLHCKKWKLAPQLRTSSGQIKSWTGVITQLVSLCPGRVKERENPALSSSSWMPSMHSLPPKGCSSGWKHRHGLPQAACNLSLRKGQVCKRENRGESLKDPESTNRGPKQDK